MIILGVDPGTNLTGFGIIKIERNEYSRISNGLIRLPRGKTLAGKLEIIYNELSSLIRTFNPDEFAIETAFYGKNVQSAMKIGYARGVSILAAVHHNIPASEYSPREVKKSVVGNGAASKQQVSFMIKGLLNCKNEKMKFDESDALAIALCHAFRIRKVASHNTGWKKFVEAHPERVIE